MMSALQHKSSSRTVCYIAASEDKLLATRLEKHLVALKKQGIITNWWRCEGTPDMRNLQALDHALQKASVFLLLISPDFLASDICTVFAKQAMQLASSGDRVVVPVLLRPSLIENAPFAHLQSIPDNGKFVTSWRDRDAAFLEVATALIKLFGQTFPSTPQRQTTPASGAGHFIGMQGLMNWERMRKYIYTNWIENLLEGQWLRNGLLINPTLHELPDAIANPWQAVMQETKIPEHSFSDDTRIIDVYDKADGALLVLGAPGTGKTMLLLALMRELIERAKDDGDRALPVFFHLASWQGKQLPLVDWFVEELYCKYDVPRLVARDWVDQQQVLPLLDGLDMLPTETLTACVNAINEYRRVYNALPLVVCSRSSEYLEQQERLRLRRAVTIQPLTEQQIDLYLASAGKLEVLRPVLTQDEMLHTVAKTPLILSILVQVDEKMITRDLGEADIEARRNAIFAAYVESVLTRREESESYSLPQAKSWLVWLACQMQRHNYIIFYPGHIQPDWLPDKHWSMIAYYLCNGLAGALLSGITLGLVGDIVGGQFSGMVAGLFGALVGGVGFAFAARRIRLVETVRRLRVKRHIGALLFSLVLWLFVLIANQSDSLAGTLTTIVVMLSLLPLLIGEMIKELPDALLDEAVVKPPDYGLQQSTHNCIRIGLLVGVSFSVLVTFCQLVGFLKANFVSYLLLALMLGLLSGLVLGGLAVLQIKGIYWLLWRSGLAPKNYAEFLGYAARHLLLSKAGSGYMVRYPLLQDYFATLPPEQD